MLASEMTDEKKKIVSEKIEELQKLLTEAIGGGMDMVVIAHKFHGPDEECEGVFLLNPAEVPLGNTHNMLMNALVLIEAAIIRQRMEMPPPGTPLN